MDAFSIATGVIAFVDFGSKLVSTYINIRRAHGGVPSELSSFERESKQLSNNTAFARDGVAKLRDRYPLQAEYLDRLTSECSLAEAELQRLVAGFKPGRGAAVLGALRGWWKQEEIQGLQAKLKSLREQTMMTVMVCAAHDIAETLDGVGKIAQGLDAVQGAIRNLQPDLHNLSPGQPLQTSSGTDRMAQGLWTSITVASKSGSQLPSKDTPHYPGHSSDAITHRVLQGIEFEGMASRESQIREPFPTSFEWLMSDGDPEGGASSSSTFDLAPDSSRPASPSHGKKERPNFKRWLESPANEIPFWITGKPASGKSTIMKFICSDTQVQESLRVWSGDFQLLQCAIYFWNPGSSVQKSQIGLLRTVLAQLLRQRSDLCQTVSRERYIYFQLAGVDAPDPSWTAQELQDTLSRLLQRLEGSCRVAVFVDGLDEFDGNLENLVAFFDKLHHEHKIKLCVSSRPWNIFRDKFKTYPSLRMEQHTRPDIEKYVHTRMADSDGFQELRQLDYGDRSIANLESQIIEKADGVFLWVVLVVEQLVITAREYNDINKIWELFDALPADLEHLYDSIRQRLQPELIKAASDMYQLLFRWMEVDGGAFGVADFWMAIHCKDPAEIQPVPDPDLSKITPPLERRLVACTGGMLQVSKPGPDSSSYDSDSPWVDFLHRSAFDWLQSIWPSVVADGTPGYDPSLVIASCLAPQVKSLHYYGEYLPNFFSFSRCCNDSQESRRALLKIIDRMDLEALQVDLRDIGIIWDGKIPISHPDACIRLHAAVFYSCAPYLRAKLESGYGFETPKAPTGQLEQYIPLRFRGESGRWWRELCNVTLDFKEPVHWKTLNMRIRIVKILVQTECVPRQRMIKLVKAKMKQDWWPMEYWAAIWACLHGKSFSEFSHTTQFSGSENWVEEHETTLCREGVGMPKFKPL